jgi:hypothetical protein
VDAIASEAVANLTTALTSLLPPAPANPALARSILVMPVRITPTGLGGFAGLHSDPAGEVLGRRVSARVTVRVAANDDSVLDSTVAQVTQAVLTTARSELEQLGLLRVSLRDLGVRPVATPGPPTPLRRDIDFDVLFEFLKLPEEAGGVIETIPLDVDTTLASNNPRVLLRGAFLEASLNLFDVIDDAAAGTAAPSAWTFDAAEQAIRQTADIRGGTDAATPNKPGTCLVLRTTPVRQAVRDFSLAAEMMSSSQGGIGLVYRFQDADNFHFALLDSRTGFRQLAKKVGGAFAALSDGGLDDTVGFTTNVVMRVRLVAQGDAFRLVVDGETVLEARDDTPAMPGRVGLLTRHCTGARFFDLELIGL